MQIGDLIQRAAHFYGDAVALVDSHRQMSFRELDAATDRVGHGLLALGLKPGDRVAVLLPQTIESVVAYYALAKAGLVRVPLNARETRADHEYKIADSGARFILREEGEGADAERVVHLDALRRMEQTPHTAPCRVVRGPEDVFRLAYTGGTTGKPKAVVLTTRGELAEIAHFFVDVLPDLRRGDTMLHAAPVTHGSGAFLLPHLMRGARNLILPRFDPGEFLQVAERENATATFLVPTMISMLLDQPGAARRKLALRRLVYGAAPIAPAVLERGLEALGKVFVQIYGQAEAPMCITCLQPEDHDRLASAGRPYTFVEVRIGDEDGRELPAGEVGEVMARGDHLMKEYWRQPAETARKFTADGWLRTGDVGRFDADGFLYLVDRKNDLIISGGFNVYPREVEDVLLAHPLVAEAAVIGVPDERWGDRVHAVVSVRGAVGEAEIMQFCAERLAGFKRPRGITIWQDIPKSPVGKILRRATRDRYLEQTRGG
ncbi:MAG: AMP-binding protein [Nevskia sp.]|nr:AMP-binding protein [Nevskia sp.]